MVFEDHQSENYVERQLYSDRIDTCFKQTGSTLRHIAIYGLPGMGKSQLVYDYVKRHHTKYLAVFAANASTLQNVEASFNLFFEKLCLPKIYEDDQGRRIRAFLQWLRKNSRWLLIFDNVQEKDYNRLKHYMPQSDYGHVMITTRSEWVGRTFGSARDNLALHIEEMLHGTAIELLLRSTQLRTRENEAIMQDLASDVVNELWHVPLTIEFVGKGHRSEEALRKILSVLRDISTRENFVDVYKQDDEPLGYDQKTADGTTTFVTLYMVGSVSPEAKQLWNVMAFLSPSWYAESLFHQIKVPLDIPLGHIACNQDTLKRYFSELYDLGFISSTHDKCGYWTHDQIQLVARVALRKEPGKQGEFASTAASWISRAFPDYNTYQKKWIHNLEYLNHARTCIGYCEQLHVETADLQRLYYTSSNYARFIGDYTSAKYLAQKATKILDASTSNKHDYFKAREIYALALRRESDFESAKTILRAMLTEQERDLGVDDPDTITTLNELGWTIYLQGSVAVSEEAKPLLQEAERFLRDAMKRREKRLTPKAGVTQHTYQNLATCLAKQNKFEEAEKLYNLAFVGHKELFGTENHHWVQHIKGNIAKMHEMQGKLEDAMGGFRGVMEWREKDINFGPKHPDTLRVAFSLARVYQKLGRREEAMELGRKTRKLYAELFGEEHQETADLDDWINRNLSGNQKEE
jgi:tetratricopeptide (TPR) repeat protein